MIIEPLLRSVESYLSSRSCLLWALEDRAYSLSELRHILGVKNDLLFRRRLNPITWRPSELRQISRALNMSSDAIVDLDSLASQLNCLPDTVRGLLLKDAQFHSSKLEARLTNADAWQYCELEYMASTLRQWQDSRRVQTLLAEQLPAASV